MSEKNKIYTIIAVILFVLLYVGLIICNLYLQQLLDKKNEIISELSSTNEFMKEYLDVVHKDSTYYVVLRLNKTGERLTYKEMGQEIDSLERELEIKDQLLVLAKNRYHFNVRYKMEGDSLFIYSFYNK